VSQVQGRRVSTGRIRVDAARAIAKLREYQLPDRTAWVLEAIRAAVAADAEDIELRGDANDVWLSWRGPPWEADVIVRLFDELVSPEPGRREQHRRLLATAINSALGLGPAHIDVYTVDAAGSGHRVRYHPELLEAPAAEADTSALELLRAEPSAPADFAGPGMVVHLRRRVGLEVLGHFLRGEPPELPLARHRCQSLAVPIRIGEDVYGRAESGADLVRVELGRDLDGFLAVVDPRERNVEFENGVMDVAELGVVVAKYPLELFASSRSPVPIRLFIDARRMPTNASRSEVRQDAYPVADAATLAAERLPVLVEELRTKLVEARTAGSEDVEGLRHAALALLACEVAGPQWGERAQALTYDTASPLRALGELALVTNAVGHQRPVAAHWHNDVVHVGPEPYPVELAPWLQEVLWLPSADDAGILLCGKGLDRGAAKRRARVAKKALRAQQRFRKHATRKARLDGSARFWIGCDVRASLASSCATPSPEPIEGEVRVLVRRAFFSRLSEVQILYEGREIEDVVVECPLPFVAVANSDRLTPTGGYRGVERDFHFHALIAAVQAAVVRCIEALALAFEGEPIPDGFTLGRETLDHELLLELVRDGIRLASALGLPVPTSGPLCAARVWPVDGSSCSIDELRELPVLATSTRVERAAIPEGRPTFVGSSADARLLATILTGTTPIVSYDRTPDREVSALPLRLARSLAARGPALAMRGEGRRGAIAWTSNSSTLSLYHAGVHLVDLPYRHRLVPCHIAVDSDELIPSGLWESWSGVVDAERWSDVDLSSWERALAQAVAEAWLGQRSRDLLVDDALSATGPSAKKLYSALRRGVKKKLEVLSPELVDQLRERPLFPVAAGLGAVELASASELASTSTGAIPYVQSPPVDELGGFRPLVASRHVARLVGWLAGRKVREASADLEAHRRKVELERRIADHLSKPLHVGVELAGPVTVPLSVEGARGVLAADWEPGLTLRVLVEGRLLVQRSLPLDVPVLAELEVDRALVDDDFVDVRGDGLARISKAVDGAIAPLVRAVAAADSTAKFGLGGQGARLVGSWLASPRAILDSTTRASLASTPLFLTVQGGFAARAGLCSIEEASRDGRVRVGSWSGEWIAASDGQHHELDAPVIWLVDQAEQLVRAFVGERVEDVTSALRSLQTRRRVAAGLIERPSVDAPRELKRTLAELGDADVGELGLRTATGTSEVAIFAHGELERRLEIELAPAVALAIEAPEWAALDHATQRERASEKLRTLVPRLVPAILDAITSSDRPDLGERVRRNLVQTLLSGQAGGRLPDAVDALSLFPTTSGQSVSFAQVQAQQHRFGNVWFTHPGSTDLPLDPDRIVLCLWDEERTRASAVELVDASRELILDAEARANCARPAVAALVLDPGVEEGAVAIGKLDGDGVRRPRGLVAPLAARARQLAGVHVYREMRPLGWIEDRCSWPTAAIIDDARLQPNRVWDGPVRDETFEQVLADVDRLSDMLLTQGIQPPEDALTSTRIGKDGSRKPFQQGLRVRGRLWLCGPPAAGSILVRTGEDNFAVAPTQVYAGRVRSLPVSGEVHVCAATGEQMTVSSMERIVTDLARDVYTRLLRQLARRRTADPDLVAAYMAHGMWLGAVEAKHVEHTIFPCFAPRPIAADELAGLLKASGSVPRVGADEPYDSKLALVDDGSVTSRVLRELFGTRLRRPVHVPPAKAMPSPAPRAQAPPSPPAPSTLDVHPLEPLATLCFQRLSALDLGVVLSSIRVARADSPLARWDRGTATVYLAGDHPRLRQLFEEISHGTSLAAPMLDLVVAHVVTVLNRGSSAVTDAVEERALVALLGPPS